jgi:hypothetical protein
LASWRLGVKLKSESNQSMDTNRRHLLPLEAGSELGHRKANMG